MSFGRLPHEAKRGLAPPLPGRTVRSGKPYPLSATGTGAHDDTRPIRAQLATNGGGRARVPLRRPGPARSRLSNPAGGYCAVHGPVGLRNSVRRPRPATRSSSTSRSTPQWDRDLLDWSIALYFWRRGSLFKSRLDQHHQRIADTGIRISVGFTDTFAQNTNPLDALTLALVTGSRLRRTPMSRPVGFSSLDGYPPKGTQVMKYRTLAEGTQIKAIPDATEGGAARFNGSQPVVVTKGWPIQPSTRTRSRPSRRTGTRLRSWANRCFRQRRDIPT